MNASSSRPSHHVFAALAEDLTWFIACPELRVLHIAAGATERPVVVHQVALTEGHGRNRSPFFVLEDASTSDDDGWMARAERVAVIHEARRKAMAEEGYQLAPLAPLVHGESGLAAMAWQLERCLEAQRAVAELEGLVVVLAPTVLQRSAAFADEVVSLVRAPSLARVRFIVVELGDRLVKPLTTALGEAAMTSACVVDPAVYRREQADALAAAAAAPVGASPEVIAGGAGPKDVVAPPRFGKPPRDAALTPEANELLARELGPAVALLGAGGVLLRKRVTGAALAMQEGRFGEAVTLQREAARQCFEAGLLQLACILEVTLAAYLLHAGERAGARETFASAAARAEAGGFPDVAAQALLGLAAVLVVEKDIEASVASYARAGELAETAQAPLLAIEAYRTAGQIALRAGAEGAAVRAWQRALQVANAAPPEAVAHSSAPTAARALAKILQSAGSFAAAQSLLAQADAYERAAGAPPPAEAGGAGAGAE